MSLPEHERRHLDSSKSHWLSRDSIVPHVLAIIHEQGLNPAECRLLDVGCAQGRDLTLYREAGIQAEGLELKASYVAEARNRDPQASITFGDMARLPAPFGCGTFDVITCFNTLFYGDSAAIAQGLTGTLRPGGIAVVTLDERILRLDTDVIIHELDVSHLLDSLSGVDVIRKEYAEREDSEPWPHRHYFYEVVVRKREG